ncbi:MULTISPECIES: YtxH domain-containing protein [Chitinophagaceae]|uniref:YtxH domain-containing protein n=1 Tax=Chitinophagaceae TaxID=563835 RepID=UPI000DEF427E|nr:MULTISPECIES: YtxH domain-containing protein [Chitinophagaceae]RPD48887.1 YtxH domain-containing protein [Paracnuella aquatica]
MTQRTKLIVGIIGAAAAGVAIGMLLAPEKGTDMRRNISKATGSWASSLSDLLANAKGELTRATTKGKLQTRRMANRAEDFI